MTRIVEDLSDRKDDNNHPMLVPLIISGSLFMTLPRQAALGSAAAAAGIAKAVMIAPPAAAIVVPIAAVVFLAAWAYDIYSKTWLFPRYLSFIPRHPDPCLRPGIIRCLMGYVVDLTVIMRAAFRASRENKDGIIQKERVEEIIEKYDKSAMKRNIHDSIRSFVQDKFPFLKSTAVDGIVSLVNQDIVLTP
jgi:hypothetical protein